VPLRQLDGIEVEISDNYYSLISMLRLYVRDLAPLNRLVDGEESKDRDLALAIYRAVEDFNGTPPPLSLNLQQIIDNHLVDLILRGAACKLMESVVLTYARNELQFTDAGVSVKISDKFPVFMNWYSAMKPSWDKEKEQVKISLNINQIVTDQPGGVFSEFWLINSLLGPGEGA
jgi:hypothetical protein